MRGQPIILQGLSKDTIGVLFLHLFSLSITFNYLLSVFVSILFKRVHIQQKNNT